MLFVCVNQSFDMLSCVKHIETVALSEYKEVEVTPKYKVGDVVTFNYFGKVIKRNNPSR